MAETKPTTVPRWADSTANLTEPSEGKKSLGWILNEAPPSSYFNWWQNLVGDWFKWLDERVGDAYDDAEDGVGIYHPGSGDLALSVDESGIYLWPNPSTATPTRQIAFTTTDILTFATDAYLLKFNSTTRFSFEYDVTNSATLGLICVAGGTASNTISFTRTSDLNYPVWKLEQKANYFEFNNVYSGSNHYFLRLGPGVDVTADETFINVDYAYIDKNPYFQSKISGTGTTAFSTSPADITPESLILGSGFGYGSGYISPSKDGTYLFRYVIRYSGNYTSGSSQNGAEFKIKVGGAEQTIYTVTGVKIDQYQYYTTVLEAILTIDTTDQITFEAECLDGGYNGVVDNNSILTITPIRVEK